MKHFIIAFLLFFSLRGNSQSLIDSLISSNFTYNDSIGYKLISFALENPLFNLIDKQIEGSKYDVTAVKGSWLNTVTASFNLNEFNITGVATDQNLFFPRYNFGLILPMGIFITKPAQIKSAKANTEVLRYRKEVEINRISTNVLEAYQRFQWNKYLLALQETILRDELLLYKENERKFKNNEIGLGPFTESARRFNNEVNRRITLMKDVNIAKYELETLIGISYDEAMQKIKLIEKK